MANPFTLVRWLPWKFLRSVMKTESLVRSIFITLLDFWSLCMQVLGPLYTSSPRFQPARAQGGRVYVRRARAVVGARRSARTKVVQSDSGVGAERELELRARQAGRVRARSTRERGRARARSGAEGPRTSNASVPYLLNLSRSSAPAPVNSSGIARNANRSM